MADTQILNNKVSSFQLVFRNSAGGGVPPISGDTYSVASSSASLGAVIGGTAAAPWVVLTPKVQAGTGYVITISDADGLPTLTYVFDIVPDPTIVTQWSLTTSASVNTVAQAIPTAPGP